MKSTSLAYRNSMKSPIREQSYMVITFGNTNTEAAEDGRWESDDSISFSETITVDSEAYSYEDGISTLELNRWILGGNNAILSDSKETYDGYISESITNAEGFFEVPPIFQRDFSTEHAVQGLTITFDSRAGELPVELIARFFLNGNLVNFQTVYPTDERTKIRTNAAAIDQIQIEFTKMIPYRRARVESVLFGFEESFTNNEIESSLMSTDVDPLSRRLPTEKFTFSVFDYEHRYDPDNPQGEYVFIEQNSPIYVKHGYTLPNGSIEWLKPDRYLLDGKPTVENSVATFTATGMIGRLNDVFYKSKIGNKNFYDMAEEVLIDAGLQPTAKGRNPWVIHDSLKTMYTTAVLPIDTHMNCLQLIAHACRCKLFTDDDNVIHIEPFSVTVSGLYSGEYSDNGHLWCSEWDTVEENKSYSSTYATLELNRWELGGFSQILPKESGATGRGYVGEQVANESGSFTEFSPFWDTQFSIDENGHLILEDADMMNSNFSLSNDGHLIYTGMYSEVLSREEDHVYAESAEKEPPSFEKTFDEHHDLQIVSLVFGGPDYDNPKSIRVDYYDDDTWIDFQTIDGIVDNEVTIQNPSAANCTRVVVSYLTGMPYSRSRVTNIYFRENDFKIGFDTIYHNTESVTKIEKLKAVSVAKYSYVAEMTGGGSGLENVDEVVF